MARNLFDLQLNGQSDVFVDGTNDLATVDGPANVRQTIGIVTRNIVRPLVGQQISGNMLNRIESKIVDALSSHTKIESVQDISIEEINRETNTVVINSTVNFDENYTVNVDV